jgi:hypothetical protein
MPAGFVTSSRKPVLIKPGRAEPVPVGDLFCCGVTWGNAPECGKCKRPYVPGEAMPPPEEMIIQPRIQK